MSSRFCSSRAWAACGLLGLLTFPFAALAQVAVEIPGRIEAEFPTTFYDTTGGNASGQSQCSTTDLDAQITSDVGGGCNVGWTSAGEWTEYEMHADETVNAEMVVRAATAQNGRSMHVEIDGANVTGTIQVANHGWQSYRDYVLPITLSAGFHTVRAVFDTGAVNLNYINFLVPEPVVPYLVPARIEAEDFHDFYDLSSGNNGVAGCGATDVDIEYTGDVDGVCNVGWTQSGEWLSYNLHADLAGDYEVHLRVASAYRDRHIQIDLNGGQQGQVVVPGTGWQSYYDVTLPLTLPLGSSVLTVSFPDGSVNLNYFVVEGPAIIDSDADGVEDAEDQCPATEEGSSVNSVGCADDDSDGVFNNEDQCSNTPVDESPNSMGCSASQLDDDGDGIFNDTDQCGNTPIGVPINSVGCTDTDSDGVADTVDLCPTTGAGATVNAQGCADDDSDSVFNNEDLCANTPSGEQADVNGCSVSQKDDDGDGVSNDTDQCGNTPAGLPINSVGCTDTDSDGVADAADLCPVTAAGAVVNGQGCADDDGDSVFNNEDQCANTPAGEHADSSGCSDSQKDDDGDGIFNDVDQCLNTPSGSNVNAAGCSDGDDDGVADTEDQCQNTLLGLLVNAVGCSDDDGDGVFNNEDQCGNTPLGEPANSVGCAPSQLDEDGDAVPDYLDLCPGTLPGALVDPMGCSETQADDDSDGVANNVDLCPTTSPSDAGSVMANGCLPWGDEDEDRVPNDLDHCVLDAGLWEVGGCKPLFGDFDSDGVPDDVDQCPYTKARSDIDPFGCSLEDFADEDMDGVLNGHDLCPWARDSGGQMKGCDELSFQDDDGDGVMNGVDFCPNEFGPKALNGCWATLWEGADTFFDDVDNDGVLNKFDHCPFTHEQAIPVDIGPNGCAQTIGLEDLDQDGVALANDVCPGSALGYAVDDKGCTYSQKAQALDTDEDGVNDALDQCPDLAGTGLLGCDEQANFLDMDRDGLPDAVDQCMSEPGHRLFGGCIKPFLGPWPNLDDRDGDGVPYVEDQCPYSLDPLPTSGELYPYVTKGCNGRDLADYDGDGVINGKDLCPNSRNRLWVDTDGCDDYDRVDNDQDGVMNGVDLCPGVFGLPAFNGCAPFGSLDDSDGDGVKNLWDHCPYSPQMAGMIDSETGCESHNAFNDDDGDGVTNDFDQCLDTPKFYPVSTDNGCHMPEELLTLDQDNDGVVDDLDLCPGTPTEEPVDATGCFTDDADGDGVDNEQDECPNTLRALPMDWNGCVLSSSPKVQTPVVLKRDENLPPEIRSFFLLEEDLTAPMNMPLVGPISFNVILPDAPEWVLVASQWGELRIDVARSAGNSPLLRPVAVQVVDGVGETSPWFTVSFPGGVTDLGALIVNDPVVLNDSGMSLTQVFDLLSRNNDSVNGQQLFRQFWDSQKAIPFGPSPFNCTGMVNGFEIACDRTETEVAFFSEMDTQMEMDTYRLTAAVNRVDLNDGWQSCGEQRLVFARDPNTPFPLWGGNSGRQFINIEARLPNPIPGDVEGCRAIIEFWDNLSSAPMFDKGFQLNELFYVGLPPFYPPLMNPEFFKAATGQIRTTQFLGGEWLFKEHKLQQLCDGLECNYWVKTGTVQDNPIGALFGPVPPVSSPEEQARADLIVQFQSWLPMNLESLMGQQLVDLNISVPDEFNNGQSHAAGMESLENDYSAHYSGQWGSAFDMNMQNAVMGRENSDGSPLMVEQVLARATTQTCGGCHAPETFGLELPGRIGALALPDGTQMDTWPQSHDFVHINEMGELSPALQEVFLPMRGVLFNDALEALNQSAF